jgi:drug/metabolite transporter (DMT)-like permease
VIVAETLTAAAFYAVAMALQQRRASSVATDAARGARLIGRLVLDPVWLGGLFANAVGFGLQFLALGSGALALVQPLLVTSLLFALLLSMALGGGALRRREWVGAMAVAGGLALGYAAARPQAGAASAPGWRWLILTAAVAVIAGAFIDTALRIEADRPLALAAAAGAVYGLIAALTRATSVLARDSVRARDILGFVAHWQPYALAASVAVGIVLVQSAFQAGPLRASLPVLMVVEPAAGIAVGVWLFHERVAWRGWAGPLELVAIALIVCGLPLVSRSQALDRTPT